MAKVLLVDTNFSSGPIHRELMDMGHNVHVIGNNPQDYLAKVSPNYWNINYADTDALGRLIAEQKFDFLVPGCTDRSYASCVAVNDGQFPGVDRNDAYYAIFNKGKFREIAGALKVPVPQRLDANLRPMPCPVIVKPVDAFSGKGITIVHEENAETIENAKEFAKGASPAGEYLIEQFVEGQLYSHSAFLRNGRVIQDFFVQEDSAVNPFVVDTSRVLQSTSPRLKQRLRESTEDLARALILADGLLHTQFIFNGEDLWLIEATRRCPGDLYSQLIELTTGYPYSKFYVLPFLGEPIPDFNETLRADPILRHTVTLNTAQTLSCLHFNQALHIERWTPLSLAGDQLMPSPTSRIGILFCRASDQKELDVIYQKALQHSLYEIRA